MLGSEGLLTNLTKNIMYFIISFNSFQSIKNKNICIILKDTLHKELDKADNI